MSSKEIKIRTGLTVEYAHSILVRDINCKDSVLDLIDNSIDAARTAILCDNVEVDSQGLPLDYMGFEINVGTDSKNQRIYIEDNCSGIHPKAMRERLLVTGEASNEPLAIGHFGVGLKRAFLKLGSTYDIETKHDGSAYFISCSANDLAKDSENVVAKQIDALGPPTYTKIHISDVSTAAEREIFDSASWRPDIVREISIRYSIFISKGLVIKYNNVIISPSCPGLRSYKSNKVEEEFLDDLPHGVKVRIKAGIHERYRYTGEDDYDTTNNSKLTEEFGWYFVCNDRVIKIACTDHEFGWAKKWHPEYYGFVGWVCFTGAVKQLPWNTKKTDIDPNSEVFSAVKSHLKEYADNYRRRNRNLKKNKDSGYGVNPSGKGQMGLLDQESADSNIGTHSNRAGDGGQPEIDSNESDSGAVNSSNGDAATPPKLDAEARKKAKLRTKIESSAAISERLHKLGSHKLDLLYYSLCKISLTEHPALMSVGAWSFFETLARLSGATQGTSFESFFNSKINTWYNDKEQKKKFKKIIGDIAEEGNLDKHDTTYYTVDGKPLAMRFKSLENFILKVLDELLDAH